MASLSEQEIDPIARAKVIEKVRELAKEHPADFGCSFKRDKGVLHLHSIAVTRDEEHWHLYLDTGTGDDAEKTMVWLSDYGERPATYYDDNLPTRFFNKVHFDIAPQRMLDVLNRITSLDRGFTTFDRSFKEWQDNVERS